MIEIRNLCKTFVLEGKRRVVADNINMVIPTGVSVGLLGRNGAGKSTLMSMIAGTSEPDAGTIKIHGSISWPVGFNGSFHPELSGAQNTRFVARIYGVDTDSLLAYVEDFAGLGEHFYLPVRTYSSGMKSRLSFGVSMGIRFDTYLVDEVTSVGDAVFKAKSAAVFKDRLRSSGALVVSHSTAQIKRLCSAAVVLENGRLTWFDDVREGIQQHLRNLDIAEELDRELEDD